MFGFAVKMLIGGTMFAVGIGTGTILTASAFSKQVDYLIAREERRQRVARILNSESENRDD